MKKKIKIGNAQAFWGDEEGAAATLLQQVPDLDYLTLDYLSEVSLSIMAIQRTKNPQSGYARDFVNVVQSLAPFWKQGSKVKVVTNAGGLEPLKCAEACAEALQKCGCSGIKIGVVYGDDILNLLKGNPEAALFNNMDNGMPLTTIKERLVTANAYLGAAPIVTVLNQQADIVITGRTADPSLTVAPCIAHFGWAPHDYDRIAQATLAGHLIECGTQVTGGISTNWMQLPYASHFGFPFVEMEENGEFLIAKPEQSHGRVNMETVKEQMLYEIGDPDAYLSPDVKMSLLSVTLETKDYGIAIKGAKGKAPPATYKVSATYQDGYRAEGSLIIFGNDAREKAKRSAQMILERVKECGYQLERSCIECLGSGDVVGGVAGCQNTLECVLRICVADQREDAVECFAKQIAPLVTCGAPGTTGYTGGRPHVRPIFGFWPCLIDRTLVEPKVTYLKM